MVCTGHAPELTCSLVLDETIPLPVHVTYVHRAYSTGLNIFGHTIASNEGACVQVMIAAGVAEGSPACFHLPVRLCPKLLQWALASKFRLARYSTHGYHIP